MHGRGSILKIYWDIFFFTILLLVLQPHSVSANPSVDWLISQQQVDGSFSSVAGVASSYQSTAETLRTLKVLGNGGYGGMPVATQYIEQHNNHSAEQLSRRIIVGAGEAVAGELVVALESVQNDDGGFGEIYGYASTTIDTAFALEALALGASTNGSAISRAIQFLVARQKADGSFALNTVNESSSYVTSLASKALQAHQFGYNLSAQISAASTYLINTQIDAGGWGTDWETASALLALIPIISDTARYAHALEILKLAQQADGSWGGDVYATALALRVLHVAQNVQIPPDPTTGTFSGRVIDDGTGLPLAGVRVAIPVLAEGYTNTGADGNFQLVGVEPGNYLLGYSIDGYGDASQSVNITAGQRVDLGTIRLLQLPDSGIIKGVITDASTGLPLGGVLIETSGAVTLSTSTSIDGSFRFVSPPGEITITVSLSGYESVVGTGSVTAGGTLYFSPALHPDGSGSGDPSVRIIGAVADASTNLAIAGATISIVDTTYSSATDGQGQFILSGIDAGELKIQISAPGYLMANALVLAPAGSTIDLGVVNLPKVIASGSTALMGSVVDRHTSAPIIGASVMMSASGLQTLTDNNGAFLLEGISGGDVVIDISAGGYQQLSLKTTTVANATVNIGSVELEPSIVYATTTISGFVSDVNTGMPIAGANVVVEGTALSATTNSEGYYTLSGVEPLNFSLFVSAAGYVSQLTNIVLSEAANVVVDYRLELFSQEGINIESVSADKQVYQAYDQILFAAKIKNNNSDAKTIKIVAEVNNLNGDNFGRIEVGQTGNPAGANEPHVILPGNIIEINAGWYTGIHVPGGYYVNLQVFDEYTNQLLAQRIGRFEIVETKKIDILNIIPTPKYTSVGAEEKIDIKAVFTNISNVAHDLTISYTLLDPDNLSIISGEKQFTVKPEDVELSVVLVSVPYRFEVSGTYPLEGGVVLGVVPREIVVNPISVAPTVRIEASQGLSPTVVVPDGDKRIKINIRLEGVEQL